MRENSSKAFQPLKEEGNSKAVVSTRRVPTWKIVGGNNRVEARLVVKGFQDPDL